MDLDAIALGEDFVEVIETTVAKCHVLIAIIGNNWLTSKEDRGSRRLDNPEDFVRMEIGTALKRRICVIPVLVDGALMPAPNDLPDDLKLLVRRNALRITDTSFDGDCQRLAAAIKLVLGKAAAEEQERLEPEQRQREEKERLEAEARQREEKDRLETEQRNIEAALSRLRLIRDHIAGFLNAQSANLQERLVISFDHHVQRMINELPTEVEKFDLIKVSMIWNSLTNWAQKDENKFAEQIQRCIKPQIQHLLELHFAEWREAVPRNEISAVRLDIGKHLQEEAAEYQRVMKEIEERIGSEGAPLRIQELLEGWLSGGESGNINVSLLPAILDDIGFGLEVAAEFMNHLKLASLPIVGLASSFRTRKQINKKIVGLVEEALQKNTQRQAAEIRTAIRDSFDQLRDKIRGNIDIQIALLQRAEVRKYGNHDGKAVD